MKLWISVNDLGLWRNIVREYSEELLGTPEHDGTRSQPIDYANWPLYQFDDLICPGCGARVRCAPPAYWKVRDGLPVAQFSHHDRTALCRTASGGVAEPVEVPR